MSCFGFGCLLLQASLDMPGGYGVSFGGILVFLAMALCIALPYYVLQRVHCTEQAVATVVGERVQNDVRRGVVHFFTLRYETGEGETVKVYTLGYANPRFCVGDRIEVRYDPRFPTRYRIV